MNIQLITTILSWITLIGQVFILLLLLSLLHKNLRQRVAGVVHKHAIILSLAVVLLSVALSLFYSEIALYLPCRLCWFQRIFMYPQAVLFIVALFKKSRDVFYYALPLTLLGGLIALYHSIIQWVGLAQPGLSDACSATGTSCISTHFVSFGYITLPVMSFTAFVLLLIFALVGRQKA